MPECADEPLHGLLQHDNPPIVHNIEQSVPNEQHHQTNIKPLPHQHYRQIPQTIIHIPKFKESYCYDQIYFGGEEYAGG